MHETGVTTADSTLQKILVQKIAPTGSVGSGGTTNPRDDPNTDPTDDSPVPFFQTPAGKIVIAVLVVVPIAGVGIFAVFRFMARTREPDADLDDLLDTS